MVIGQMVQLESHTTSMTGPVFEYSKGIHGRRKTSEDSFGYRGEGPQYKGAVAGLFTLSRI